MTLDGSRAPRKAREGVPKKLPEPCFFGKEIVHFQICFFFIADSYFEYQSTAIQKKMVLRISSDDILKLRGTIVPCKFYAETEYKSRQVEGGGIQIFHCNPRNHQNHCQNINPGKW